MNVTGVTMRFLVDVNARDKRITQYLNHNGYKHNLVGDKDYDLTIARKSRQQQAIIITRDSDFTKGQLLNTAYGVIYIPQICKNITILLQVAIQNLNRCNRKVGFDEECKLICL